MFSFCPALLWGQLGSGSANSPKIKGRVVDAGNGEPIEAVTIINTNSQKAAFTDNKGRYQIECEPGDKIVTRYLGYKQMALTISAGSEYIDNNFALVRESVSLANIIIRPNYTPYQADSAYRYSVYKRTMLRKREGSLASPVTFLAERLSGTAKRRERFQKAFNELEKERFAETRYTSELVYEMTHLTGDTLAYFINQYKIPDDYVRTTSDLELKMWIRTNYRDWKAKGMPLPALTTDSLKR